MEDSPKSAVCAQSFLQSCISSSLNRHISTLCQLFLTCKGEDVAVWAPTKENLRQRTPMLHSSTKKNPPAISVSCGCVIFVISSILIPRTWSCHWFNWEGVGKCFNMFQEVNTNILCKERDPCSSAWQRPKELAGTASIQASPHCKPRLIGMFGQCCRFLRLKN